MVALNARLRAAEEAAVRRRAEEAERRAAEAAALEAKQAAKRDAIAAARGKFSEEQITRFREVWPNSFIGFNVRMLPPPHLRYSPRTQ